MNEIIVFGRKVGSDFLMAFMLYFHGIISDLAISYMADKEVVMYWFYCTHFLS